VAIGGTGAALAYVLSSAKSNRRRKISSRRASTDWGDQA